MPGLPCGGEYGWTSWELEDYLVELERYAPRGLRFERDKAPTRQCQIVRIEGTRFVARLNAPGNHPALWMRIEIGFYDSREQVALAFHHACQRWLESVA